MSTERATAHTERSGCSFSPCPSHHAQPANPFIHTYILAVAGADCLRGLVDESVSTRVRHKVRFTSMVRTTMVRDVAPSYKKAPGHLYLRGRRTSIPTSIPETLKVTCPAARHCTKLGSLRRRSSCNFIPWWVYSELICSCG